MPSTFTWLDYSEHERRKMLDVVDLLGEKTTRDELGLGGVRDAFADLLFPGTSTIQTVAKYFLFVPWIYRDLEASRTPSSKVELRARKLEIELAQKLEVSGETEGVIGRIAKEKLQRLPSSIYWQGLLKWGIRKFAGSQDEYHRSLDLFYQRQRARHASRHEYEGESFAEPDLHNWHDGIPPAPAAFPDSATLALTKAEAEYLRERVLTNCSQSLLAYLIRERITVKGFPFSWDLPVELPAELRRQVEHARNFSEAVHGAQLLYNLLLAENGDPNSQRDRRWTEEYRAALSEWWQLVSRRMDALQKWNRSEFWSTVREGSANLGISRRAQRFIDAWIDLIVSAAELTDITDGKSARHLVADREIQLKGEELARVRSQRARELWNGASGAAQLDLRWRSARRIISDILVGLKVETDA